MEKHLEPGCYWIRFWKDGAGIHIRDVGRFPLLFSGREGYQKYLRIRNWTIKFLKPETRLSQHQRFRQEIEIEQQMQMEDWQENDPSEDFIISPPASPEPFTAVTAGHYHYANGRVTRIPDFEGVDSVCFCPEGEWLERDANGYVINAQNAAKLREDLETQKAELPLFALDARRKLRVE